MSKSTNSTTTTTLKVLGIGIVIIQLLDIFIHAATNQLEVLRVSSNAIIFLWLAGVALGRFKAKFLLIAISFIGLYLVLNFIFLVREGVTNVEQGGGLRIALFLLVFLTIALSTALTYMHNHRTGN